jgi:hypothetical protein
MSNPLLTGLGLATLLAGTALPAQPRSAPLRSQSAARPLERPVRRRAAASTRSPGSSSSSRRSRRRWPSSSPRSTASPRRKEPDLRQHDRSRSRGGRTLDRVMTVFGIYTSHAEHDGRAGGRARDGAEARGVLRPASPRTRSCSHASRRSTRRARVGLTPEQQRLTWLLYTNFVRAGAQLDAAGQEAALRDQPALATLYTKFSQNVLADEQRPWTRPRLG